MDKMHYLLLCAALPIALIAQEKTPVAPVQGEITSVSDFFVKADRSTLSPDETIVKCLKLSENKSFRIIKRADGTLTKQAEKAYDKLVNILAFGTTQGFVEKRSVDLLDGWMDDVIRNEI